MKIQSGGVQAYAATNFTSARAARFSTPEIASDKNSPANSESSRVDFSNMTRHEMKKAAQHLWEEELAQILKPLAGSSKLDVQAKLRNTEKVFRMIAAQLSAGVEESS